MGPNRLLLQIQVFLPNRLLLQIQVFLDNNLALLILVLPVSRLLLLIGASAILVLQTVLLLLCQQGFLVSSLLTILVASFLASAVWPVSDITRVQTRRGQCEHDEEVQIVWILQLLHCQLSLVNYSLQYVIC